MEHLILLHGAIGAKDQLEPLAEKLKNKYTIHTISFSGHGGEAMPETFGIEVFANDVLYYLKQNNISKTNIFGYSMGGYVALYLAKQYPEKINKVMTLATKFLWTPVIAQHEIKMLDADKITEKLPAFAQTLAGRHQPGDWKIVLQKTIGMMTAMGNKNPLSLQDYETIEHPVMISIGDKDSMVTLEETTDVCRKLKNARLTVFPDTPHPIEKADPDKLVNEVIGFFK